MERRTVLTAAAAAAVPTIGIAPAIAADSKTYVLVHGTWHGGWVWKHVRRNLTARGHEVFAPSCTGCGDRKHLMSPDVGLETHVTDITNLIEYEELSNVILVGHSFAGLTITGVADRMKDRIRRLVFLDALVPRTDRMSGVSRGPDGALPEYWKKREAKFIDGYQMDFFAEYPMEMLVPADDAANIAWLKRRLTPHPARGWSDMLELRNGGWEGVPRTFLHCVAQVYSPTSPAMVGPARDDPGWDYRAMPWARDAMVTHPNELSEVLDELA
ncbi:MAG: alpha/beta hydrolase [Rhodospirillaceae bacterium]|nr:alpha/beta hydrolase [Rhodospirillaceae bacterium]